MTTFVWKKIVKKKQILNDSERFMINESPHFSDIARLYIEKTFPGDILKKWVTFQNKIKRKVRGHSKTTLTRGGR